MLIYIGNILNNMKRSSYLKVDGKASCMRKPRQLQVQGTGILADLSTGQFQVDLSTGRSSQMAGQVNLDRIGGQVC